MTKPMDTLVDQLKSAADIDRGGDHLKGVTYSLAYVIQALAELGYAETRPLEKLLMALGDLGLGIQPPLLTAEYKKEGPRQGHEETFLHATAATLIDVLSEKARKDGKSKKEAETGAAIVVAELMKDNDLPLPGKRDTDASKTLLNWRKNTEYEGKNPIAVSHYKNLRAVIDAVDPAEVEKWLRERLTDG